MTKYTDHLGQVLPTQERKKKKTTKSITSHGSRRGMWRVNPGQFEGKYGQNSSFTCIKFTKNKFKIIIKNKTGSTLLEDWDSILINHVGSNNYLSL